MNSEDIEKIIKEAEEDDKEMGKINYLFDKKRKKEIQRIFSEEIFDEIEYKVIHDLVYSSYKLGFFLDNEKSATQKFSALSKRDLVKRVSILEALVKFLDEKIWTEERDSYKHEGLF